MKDLVAFVGEDLSLREDLLSNIDSEQELLRLIERYVEELINSDFSRLLQLLYRLDVGEQKVKEAIDSTKGEKASETIALLILKREKEKLKSRQHFREENNEGDDWIF